MLSVLLAYRRSLRLLICLAAAQTVWLALAAHFSPAPNRVFTSSEWRTQVAVHGFLILVLVLFGYGWFGTFFRMEGRRYYAAHTEIKLASSIQQQLVPPVAIMKDQFEVFGKSVPTGTVGGDLIDAVDVDGLLCAYVADVAGHGVAAGVLMSMVKTAVRMHLMTSLQPGYRLLEAINRALVVLTGPASYATFAYILINRDREVVYSAAAHPPLFHLQHRTGRIVRSSVENLPIGMFPETSYHTASIEFHSGDILAIVTDGLIEIFDPKDRELGDSYISNILMRSVSRPLHEVADAIFNHARSFGEITDDQTLLLVRRQNTAT
jgi:serine phosphatase RsbU (regulator of sigma subunit)